MSTPFQNRLVGTIIIAAVAIIFLPDLLDGEKKTFTEEFDNIPEVPRLAIDQEAKPFPSERLAELPKEQISNEAAVDEKSPAKADDIAQEVEESAAKNVERIVKPTQSSKKTKLPEKSVPKEAWVVQLGSYSNKNNVDRLVDKLEKAGYTVFTRPIKTKTKTLTKVFVGPEISKSKLERELTKLAKISEVQGKIAKFVPTS